MRCPTCGTENTPDSRFCGGCGAKLSPSETPRVARTAKIPDDAPFAPTLAPNSYPPTHATGPTGGPPAAYSSGHANLPPVSHRPASIPPSNGPVYTPRPGSLSEYPPNPAPAAPGATDSRGSRTRAPVLAEPSMSMAAATPPKRWGLIILVLMLDLGLATAGAVMLSKGLAKPDKVPSSSKVDPSPVELGSGSAGSAAAAPITPPAAAGSAAAPPPPEDPKVAVSNPPRRDAKKSDKPVKTPPPDPGGPQDPYDAKRLTNEIELAATRAREAFDRCYLDAGGSGTIHGVIKLGFQVLKDGHVAGLAINENTTGSNQLADCLTGIIEHWTFASHPANPAAFVRPFNYP